MYNLYSYYINKNFNPVPITLSSKKQFKEHILKRNNLIQNHLKMKLSDFNSKKILEFGCNSGENSLVLANLGASLTLVEPNQIMIPLIYRNFKKYNKNKFLEKVYVTSLDKFKSKKKFDYVFAEGFLNTLKNRNKYLKKLLNFCSMEGSLIINYDDKVGGFIELLKSVIFIKIINQNKLNFESHNAFIIAKKLFFDEFSKMNTSRNFKAWYQDQLSSPFAADTWSLKEILKIAGQKKFICFSTSPLLLNSLTFQWYKDSPKSTKINKIFEDSVFQNLEYLFTGKVHDIPTDKRNFDRNYYKILKISENLSKIIKSKNSNIKIKFRNLDFKFLDKNNKILKKEIINIINLYNKNNKSDKLISTYLNTKYLKKTWGSLLHYVHLARQK